MEAIVTKIKGRERVKEMFGIDADEAVLTDRGKDGVARFFLVYPTAEESAKNKVAAQKLINSIAAAR